MKNLVWVIFALVLVGTMGFPSLAQADEAQAKSTIGFVFALGEHRMVGADAVATGLVTFGTDVEIDGTVSGDLLLIGGDLTVRGMVEGGIIVIGGDVRLLDGAVVRKDVFALGGEVYRADGATVAGRVRDSTYWEDQFAREWERGGWTFWRTMWARSWVGFLIGWFALIVLGYLSLHFLRTPILHIGEAVSHRFWITLAIGLAAVVIAGPLAVLLAMTGLGILVIYPLAVAYVVAAFLGFVALSILLEGVLARAFHLSVKQGSTLFLLSTLIITAVRMIPFVGETTTVIISLIGIGAAVLTRFGVAKTHLGQHVPEANAALPD